MDFIAHNLTFPALTGDCWETFLDALKINFPNFAEYSNGTLYFLPGDITANIQLWIDGFTCSSGESQIYNNAVKIDADTIVQTVDPTITENMDRDIIWVNKTSGEIFTCIDATIDKNVWRGTTPGKIIRPVPEADKFDFFNDNSCIAFYQLNGNALDVGGKYHGKDKDIEYKDGLEGDSADSNKGKGQIEIKGLPFNENTSSMTVSGWVKWNGINYSMPFGFYNYDLMVYRGNLGFNTSQGDITGIDFTPYEDKWVYLTAVFRKGVPGEIYIEGATQTLQNTKGTFSVTNSVMKSTFNIFGWEASSGYRNFGTIERVRLFNRGLTPFEIQTLANAERLFIDNIQGDKK